jgi:2-C-methyl-D-erythritol 2,4-cyclodiphosphate synthase
MMRIGHGYDIHRFEEVATKNYIMLGGVKIAYERGIQAHSDGDVVIHAICDALLGACALGDIGKHFPDTESENKNKDSREFLRNIMQKVKKMGFCVGNVDVSIIAQVPKLAPYILNMQEVLAEDLQVSLNQINVKATTNENLDAVGNRQGIAVHAVALLEKM